METPPPPFAGPQPPKESLARRYKFVWRFLLISNLALGAYLFARARKRDIEEGKVVAKVHAVPVETKTTPVPEESVVTLPIVEPPKLREPIPEDQQRELFRWMLEEKRKVKAKDREEKQRIDEEKAILKQFISAKDISRI